MENPFAALPVLNPPGRILESGSLVRDGVPQPLRPPTIWEGEGVPETPAEPVGTAPTPPAAESENPFDALPVVNGPEAMENPFDALPTEAKAPVAPDKNIGKSGVLAGIADIGAGASGAIAAGGRLLDMPKVTQFGEENAASMKTMQQRYAPETTLGKVAEVATASVPYMALPIGGAAAGAAMLGKAGQLGGLALGTIMSAYGLTAGDLYNSLIDAKVKPEDAAKWAAGGAAPLSIFYSVPPAKFVSKLFGQPAESAVVKGVVRRMAEGAAKEGLVLGGVGAATETGKEAIESLATGQTMEQRGGMGRIGEGAAGMALMGVPFGAAAGARRPGVKAPTAEAPPKVEEPPVTAKAGSEFDQPIPEFIKMPKGEAPAHAAASDVFVPRTFKIEDPGAPSGAPEPIKSPAPPPAEPPAFHLNEATNQIEPIPAPPGKPPEPLEPTAFNKEVSKRSRQKGLQVFGGEGDAATFDPLTKIMTVGKDLHTAPEHVDPVAALAQEPENTAWRQVPIDAELEDGSTAPTTAGEAADAIADRMKKAMKVLACVG